MPDAAVFLALLAFTAKSKRTSARRKEDGPD
jgi:hypothetical protein